uniref:N-alpha-acetyltransferase 60 n=1 Tax=Plectus sambesii TaxID=2011161 RepID=A0A914VIQ4_9BILA
MASLERPDAVRVDGVRGCNLVGTETVRCSSKEDICMRYLAPTDIDAVKKLCREVFPIEYPDYWYSEITSNRQLFSMAASTCSDNRVIALLVAEIKTLNQCNPEDRDILAKSFPANTQVAYILSLGVSSEFRRRGLASRLLDHFIQYLTTGFGTAGDTKAIYLHVLCENHSAIHLYQKRHFQKHATLPHYYRIDQSMRDGYTYVLYVNGGEPPWSVQECCKAAFGVLFYPLRRFVRLLTFDLRRFLVNHLAPP